MTSLNDPGFAGGFAPPEGLSLLGRGKVRDLYAVDEVSLLLVASDRISAFDVVLPTLVPGKGEVLTGLTRYWLEYFGDLVPTQLLGWRARDLPAGARHLAGRALLVRRLSMLPYECVARGYLVGSGWEDYCKTGAVCGVGLPPGLRQADRLPQALFTPAIKASSGHDENVSLDHLLEHLGTRVTEEVQRLTLEIYRRGAAAAHRAGLLLADTKLEFGLDNGQLVLADEVLTPDSSRLWLEETWRPGSSPPSFDKQYVRDWLRASSWDRTGPPPSLPDDVVTGTAARYAEAFLRLTGASLDDWRAQARAGGEF